MDQNDPEYQEYLEYLEFMKATGQSSAEPVSVNTQPGAFGRTAQPSRQPTQAELAGAPKRIANVLPAAGGLVGSLTPMGPFVGGVAGAAAGSAIKQAIVGDTANPVGMVKDAAMDTVQDGVIPGAIGKGIGLGFKGMAAGANAFGNAAKNAKSFQWAKGLLQKEETINPALQEKLGEAKELFNKKQIGPRMAEQRSRAETQTIKLDPERFKGVSPEIDEYLETLKIYQPDPYGAYRSVKGPAVVPGSQGVPAGATPKTVVTGGAGDDVTPGFFQRATPPGEGYGSYAGALPEEKIPSKFTEVRGEGTPAVPGTAGGAVPFQPAQRPHYTEQEIPMREALKLREMLNREARFLEQGPNIDSAIRARGESARQAGDQLRYALGEADPSILQLSDELLDAYNLRDATLRGTAKNPGGVFAASNISKGGRLSQFDEAAGTDLRGMGEALDDAQIAMSKSRSSKFIGPASNPTPIGLMKYIGSRTKETAAPVMSKFPSQPFYSLADLLNGPVTQGVSEATPKVMNLKRRME